LNLGTQKHSSADLFGFFLIILLVPTPIYANTGNVFNHWAFILSGIVIAGVVFASALTFFGLPFFGALLLTVLISVVSVYVLAVCENIYIQEKRLQEYRDNPAKSSCVAKRVMDLT
jgi:hypothetical protein